VAALVYELYNKLPQNGKPSQNDSTVIAAVIEEFNGNYRVISLATGTKCIGANLDNSQGCMLSDSHAEVLARRGFIRYIYKSILGIISMDNLNFVSTTCPIESYFCSSYNTTRFRLKNGILFHLYVSESPCGDASIYSLANHKSIGNMCDWKYTGAKPLDSSIVTDREGTNDYQKLSIPRTKSCRSNIPLNDRTRSLSCSDKILKWIGVGIQG